MATYFSGHQDLKKNKYLNTFLLMLKYKVSFMWKAVKSGVLLQMFQET